MNQTAFLCMCLVQQADCTVLGTLYTVSGNVIIKSRGRRCDSQNLWHSSLWKNKAERMIESEFDIWLVIKWQNTHFHQFPKRFNRPALCYIGVQWSVQTPSKTEASTDPNLSRSCQPLRDTTRAIRDTTGCPRSEDINSKINGEKHV